MKEIIPTILVQDRLEFERRLGILERKVPMVQMDIMDGKFVKNTTFADPEIAAQYKIGYELDLMVADPEPVLETWKKVSTVNPHTKNFGVGVKRAFVHAEIQKPLTPLLKKIKSYGWEAGVAINPDTPWEVVKPFINLPSPQSSPTRGEEVKEKSLSLDGRGQGEGAWADCILFMTVYPGQNAAPFQKKVIPKIAQFHTAHPEVPIEVDGGVNERTLPLLLQAGVTRFAAGSAIWSAPEPLKAYKKLLKVITRFNS